MTDLSHFSGAKSMEQWRVTRDLQVVIISRGLGVMVQTSIIPQGTIFFGREDYREGPNIFITAEDLIKGQVRGVTLKPLLVQFNFALDAVELCT